jgi:hypothetical protein
VTFTRYSTGARMTFGVTLTHPPVRWRTPIGEMSRLVPITRVLGESVPYRHEWGTLSLTHQIASPCGVSDGSGRAPVG